MFDIKCSNDGCDWLQRNNYDDPFCPALSPASEDCPPGENLRLLDPYHRFKNIPEADLPKCPKCTAGMQRPAVVWYGEDLDKTVLECVDDWMNKGNVDLVLVVGTSAATWPAARYIMKAKHLGARLVVIKPDAETQAVLQKLEPRDFAFGREVAECLPVLLEPVIGAFHGNGELRKE